MNGITWLASYPKSGSTWLRVFLANYSAESEGGADINRLRTGQFSSRDLWDEVIGWETAELLASEREALRLPAQESLAGRRDHVPMKTHEVFSDPGDGRPRISRSATRRVVYLIRNPLDIVVSLSHHAAKTVEATIDFMNDARAALTFGPHASQETQLLCDWSTHVRSWVDEPGLPLCVLRYEDMLAAPEPTFGRAIRALGWAADEGRIAQAVAKSQFSKLQQQEARTGFVERMPDRIFFRAGRSGDWRGKLTPRQVDRIVARHEQVMRRFGYLPPAGANSR